MKFAFSSATKPLGSISSHYSEYAMRNSSTNSRPTPSSMYLIPLFSQAKHTTFKERNGAGGGPPGKGRAPGTRRPLPPFPRDLAFGVCGIGRPETFFISQIHLDELPAVTGVTIYAAPHLLHELQEKRSFYMREEFGNKFIEFEGECYRTWHTTFKTLPNGAKRECASSYCYVVGCFGYVDESVEVEELLGKFRERGLVPLYHW